MIAGYTLENEHFERKVMEGDGSDEFPFQVSSREFLAGVACLMKSVVMVILWLKCSTI